MNYSNFIVKILKKPKQSLLKKKILLTELRVQFPSIRNKTDLNIVELSIWGDVGKDIMKYYRINDYILVEGFISLRREKLTNHQQIKISVFRIYPLNKDKIQINSTF